MMEKHNTKLGSTFRNVETMTIHNNTPYRHYPDEDQGPFRSVEVPVHNMMLYFFPGIENGRTLDQQLLEVNAVRALLGIDDWNDTSKIRVFFTSQRVPVGNAGADAQYADIERSDDGKRYIHVTVPRIMQLNLGTPKMRGRRVYRFGETWVELRMSPDLQAVVRHRRAVADSNTARVSFVQPRTHTLFMTDEDLELRCPGQPFTSTDDKEGRKFMDLAIHPHISNGNACWGDREGQMNNSQYKGQITDFLGGCKQFISIWNRNGAYWDINQTWRSMESQGGTLRDMKLDDYIILQGAHQGRIRDHDDGDHIIPDEVLTGIRCMSTVWIPLVKRVAEYTKLTTLEASQLIGSMMYDMDVTWNDTIRHALNIEGIQRAVNEWQEMFPNFRINGFGSDACHNDDCLGNIRLDLLDSIANGSCNDIRHKSEIGKYIDYQDDVPGATELRIYQTVGPMGNAYLRMENAQYWLSSIQQIQVEWACYCIRAMTDRDWRRYLKLSREWKYRVNGYRDIMCETDDGLTPYLEKIEWYMQTDWFFNNLKKCLTLLSGGITSFARQAGFTTYEGHEFKSFALDINIKKVKVDKKRLGYRRFSTLFPEEIYLDSAIKLLHLNGYRTYLENLVRETEKTRRKIREITINDTTRDAPQGEIFVEPFSEDGMERASVV